MLNLRENMDILKKGVWGVLVVSLTSCTVGPNYVRPVTVVSPKFKEAKQWKPIQPQDACKRGPWWTVFNDAVLNDLEEELNKYNQNLANAEANYRQSMAIVDEARASYFPVLAGAFNLFRQKAGTGTNTTLSSVDGTTTTGTTSSGVITSALPTTTTYSALLNASWEPDIWGLVRRTVESDVSAAQANAALLAVTALSAQASLAQFYFELRTLDKDQRFLDDTVKAYQNILNFTRNQYTSGVAGMPDVVAARSLLESAQASALNNGILRGQYEHAIAMLIGRPPAYFTLKTMPLKAKPPIIPVTIPSVWLERRPDIAQAERLMQRSSALIGVAIAAYYPVLTLTGTASAAARSFRELIHTPVLGWSAGLQLAQTFFDGGLRAATVRAAKAGYEAQVAAYRQVVLNAFQDVEDNLIALRILKQQSIVQNKAAASAALALKLALNQYKAGTIAYSSVITFQIQAFTAQKAANDVDGLQMTTAVGLIKALGGGWMGVVSQTT